MSAYLTYVCDHCGAELRTATNAPFRFAADEMRDAGWWPIHKRGVWLHFCSNTCETTYKRTDG